LHLCARSNPVCVGNAERKPECTYRLALTAQSSKSTAGAITVVEVIITDGAEATITVGDIITIGETKF
jgi:hypothetical protein